MLRKYYTKRRAAMVYYSVAARLAESAEVCGSILDVGCADVPFVTLFTSIADRTVIDIRYRSKFAATRAIKADFLQHKFNRTYDLVSCLQVLEHQHRPEEFVAKLFSVASKLVLISIPWNWPAGAAATHVQDPVDDRKVARWVAGRHPIASRAVRDGDWWRKIYLYAADAR